jgi:hypothetical protein
LRALEHRHLRVHGLLPFAAADLTAANICPDKLAPAGRRLSMAR